jgi:hypothetical protein
MKSVKTSDDPSTVLLDKRSNPKMVDAILLRFKDPRSDMKTPGTDSQQYAFDNWISGCWLFIKSQGSVCKVRTKDPENYDEEVKSLVTAWRLSRLVSSIGQAGILDGSYQRQLNKHIGPLDRNCRWTLWKIQDSEPRVFKTDSESREEVSSLYPRKNSHG